MGEIHSSAVIDSGVVLGENVTVGAHVVIESDVRIGDDCVIGPHAVIMRYSSLGPACKVHAGAVIGDVPQDQGFEGALSSVEIGARCTIREGVTIHRGSKPDSVTEIGDDCFLMAFSHCAHNVKLGKGVVLVNGVLLGGYVEVGDGAFIGGNAGVHQFARIGRLVMMGGNSGVSLDVLPFMMVKTLCFNSLAGPNSVGLRRAGIDSDTRREIKRAFVFLCHSELSRADALKEIRDTLKSPEAEEICRFAESSDRGICRT